MSKDLASDIFEQAYKIGVREFCLCPGARNYLLASYLFEDNRITTYFHTDERSAAFFAIGRIKKDIRPVGVITTSGTAVGELLAATMEAYYTGFPLLLITADRPKSYRHSGAPQACEQANIFGIYTPFSLDLQLNDTFDLDKWNQNYPAHINACFEDPKEMIHDPLNLIEDILYPKKRTCNYEGWTINQDHVFLKNEGMKELTRFLNQTKYPFVVVSALKQADREPVVDFLLRLNAPVYLESPSCIREDERLKHIRIHISEQISNISLSCDYPIDGVLRLGGIPTFRYWRDVEETGKLEVLSINDIPFTGLSWGKMVFASLSDFFRDYTLYKSYDLTHVSKWLNRDQCLTEKIQHLVEEYPSAQLSLTHKLSKIIPPNSMVFLGNSLSIRDWDLISEWKNKGYEISAIRGLNGIDGQISTFLGMLDEKRENWALIGDLTTIYDMGGFWILRYLKNRTSPIRIVVMNNHGGKIFSSKFSNTKFQNIHNINFEFLAKFWNLDYERWDDIPDNLHSKSKRLLIEIRPDETQSIYFTQKFLKT